MPAHIRKHPNTSTCVTHSKTRTHTHTNADDHIHIHTHTHKHEYNTRHSATIPCARKSKRQECKRRRVNDWNAKQEQSMSMSPQTSQIARGQDKIDWRRQPTDYQSTPTTHTHTHRVTQDCVDKKRQRTENVGGPVGVEGRVSHEHEERSKNGIVVALVPRRVVRVPAPSHTIRHKQ